MHQVLVMFLEKNKAEEAHTQGSGGGGDPGALIGAFKASLVSCSMAEMTRAGANDKRELPVAFYVRLQVGLPTAPRAGRDCPHFTDEETVAWRGQTCHQRPMTVWLSHLHTLHLPRPILPSPSSTWGKESEIKTLVSDSLVRCQRKSRKRKENTNSPQRTNSQEIEGHT